MFNDNATFLSEMTKGHSEMSLDKSENTINNSSEDVSFSVNITSTVGVFCLVCVPGG